MYYPAQQTRPVINLITAASFLARPIPLVILKGNECDLSPALLAPPRYLTKHGFVMPGDLADSAGRVRPAGVHELKAASDSIFWPVTC